jgi:hypothetical protein
MHLEEYGVFGERSLDDVPLDADGSLTLWLLPEAAPARLAAAAPCPTVSLPP